MSEPKCVLFVCTGNICRSPMAEGLLKSLIEKKGIQDVQVASAGTSGLKGERASGYAVKICKNRGIDISGHVARILTREMIQESDLVIVMEIHQMEKVLELEPKAVPKTFILTEFSDISKGPDFIADPYGLPEWAFEACYEQMEKNVIHLFERYFLNKDEKN